MKKRLTQDEARDFAWGDLEGYEIHHEEVDKDLAYKDLAPATTVCVDENGDLWKLGWLSYVSHYGSGDHEYPEQEITKVVLREEQKITIVKNWDEVE